MINILDVLGLHKLLIDRFGGSFGVRDEGALDSAINRPFMTFDGVDLYQSPIEKAAALIESLAKNHPFVDGNKRTAYYLSRKYLNQNNIEIIAKEDEKYDFVINIASGNYSFEDIIDWLNKNTQSIAG